MTNMPESICIFEDQEYSRFYPLSLTRPLFDLRCGALTLLQKSVRRFPGAQLSLFCRKYLADVVQEQYPSAHVNRWPDQTTLFVNARVLVSDELLQHIKSSKQFIYTLNDKVVAALLHKENIQRICQNKPNSVNLDALDDINRNNIVDGGMIRFLWNLVNLNPKELINDFNLTKKNTLLYKNEFNNVIALNKADIRIGAGSRLKPGVVLDAEEGPILIGENVLIMSNSVIQGPAFIGDNSVIKIGAKIYGGTSIGEYCKVGGEIEGTIFHSFTNKQHDGFLGHSYLGEWVNLGADTNNSDLKNNYGKVKVFIDGEFIDSGNQFVGLFMGDHSKSGINTMFNTGTVCGVASNVFGAGFPPKNIPSFSWGGSAGFVEHQFEKALTTGELVMARRNIGMTPAYKRMLRNVFELTQPERERVL